MTETNTIPTRAYDLLEPSEKEAVDEYIDYVIEEQHIARERIIHALYKPIPYEYLVRHKKCLYKPIVLAAVAERIKEEAHIQDISPDRVIEEHAAIAFSNISDYMEAGQFGEIKLKDLSKVSREKMEAVKSIEAKPGMYGISTKIVLHDKHPSLKAMGEMMGLVAPDKPAPLLEYVKPPKKDEQLTKSPEQLYTDLLETV